ncbi:amino acid transporter [Herbihabitans rhizosphaerae]|uniref:Amino acid transporter n=1 Tax=Herbihabitans rhizosphaerae TaxID=1872711 RepID=A0A4Q7KC26_9PSEU|nr:APC family permease [Herbihabitans rhizosphaerae]RZS30537.1 amino acid transporter [Herbihabitans rhizosphaerae]
MSTRSPGRQSLLATTLRGNRLGVPSVLFFVMSAATPLTVIAGVVTTGYATTGLTAIPIAFVVVAVVLTLFAVGFVAMAPHVANAGAFYAYISRGIGRPFGVAGAWIALLAYNALQVGLYGAIGAATAPLLAQWFGWSVSWWVIALVAWALVAVLGVQQVDVNGKVLAVLLLAEVAVILVFSGANLANPAGGGITFDTLNPANLFGSGVGALLALAVLGFVGFESAVVFSEESKDPGRTVRIATYLSVGLIAALYTLGSWSLSVATGPDRIVDEARAQSTELLFTLAGQHLGEGFLTAGRVLFVTSILAAMISFHNTTARYAFALGRERVLPAFIGRASPRSGSPRAGSVLQSLFGLVVIVLYAGAGWDPLVHLFYWGGTSGGLGVLLLIAATSIAVIAFFARNPSGEGVWRRLLAPLLASAAVITIVVLVLNNFTTVLGVEPSSPLRWIVPGGYLAIAVLGVIWGLVLKSGRPEVYAAIGLGAKAAATEAGIEIERVEA